MATSQEMDDLIKLVMVKKNLDMRMATAWVLGYVTSDVQSLTIHRAMHSLNEENN